MNETNSVANASQGVDWLLRTNEQLQGLPAWPFTVVVCVVAGYALKSMPFVFTDNRFIPAWVFGIGITVNLVLSLATPTASLRAGIISGFRAALMGLIAGVVAKVIYDKWLKKYDRGNTEFFKRHKPLDPPASHPMDRNPNKS